MLVGSQVNNLPDNTILNKEFLGHIDRRVIG